MAISANVSDNRVDRRLRKYQTGKRRVVVAIRARKGRTLTFVTKRESEGVAIVKKTVTKGSILFADEARHWDHLALDFDMGRIDHGEAYSLLDGTHTNGAESYFSRLRRMVRGQHHWVSPKYLYQYANNAAWLEDHRRVDNGNLVSKMVRNVDSASIENFFDWQRSG